MNCYQTMEPETAALDTFPGLRQEDLAEVERRFNAYLFYRADRHGRRVWTTCCHREDYLNGREAARAQTGTHGDRIACPFCGEPVHVVCKGRLRSGASLRQYIPFLFLHASEDGQTVWAQGYWTTRNLLDEPRGRTLFWPTRCYRFRPGEWRQWEHGWRDGGMVPCNGKWAQEPFRENGMYSGYASYYVVNYDCLEDSFLRYTGYDALLDRPAYWDSVGKRQDLVRYLAMASLYPKQVEMLRKAGIEELPAHYIYGQRKNTDVFQWKEKDPRKAFRLTTPELRAFLRTSKRLDILRLYRAAQGGLSFARCDELAARIGDTLALDAAKTAGKLRIPMQKVAKKLLTNWNGTCRGCAQATTLWLDYLDAAEKLGWDLTTPLIQMPRELERKHDEATQAVQAEADRIENEKAAARYAALCQRYAYTDGAWLIRPAETAEEIVREGKALCHCVGGYAKRHAEGMLAILFLRKASDPDEPYMTIEMQGDSLRQIHGYKNDQNGPNPWTVHKDLLDSWLAWVKAGSKRDKNGNPKLFKKQEDVA